MRTRTPGSSRNGTARSSSRTAEYARVLDAMRRTAQGVHQIGQALRADARFALVETFETLLRPWHVAPNSVRPDHRMVAHTGFIMTAMRLADDA